MTFPRDLQPELMDDPALSQEEHQHALTGLSRLNLFSGVIGGMYRQIRRTAQTLGLNSPVRLLDVASGSGDLPIAWARRAKRDGLDLQVTSTDISPVAVDQQQERAKHGGVQIDSVQADCLKGLPGGFDLVTCSLFMHHLNESQTKQLVANMYQACRHAILVCDLERSRLNYGLVGFASRALTRSHVVHTDALLSVKNAYTRNEFATLATEALQANVDVHGMFPCRFVLVHPKQES